MSRLHAQAVNSPPRGVAALVTILVMAAVALSVALSVSLGSVTQLVTGLGERQSAQSLAAADGCAEDSILHLARDSAYAGGTVGLGEATCTVSVESSGSLRTIHVTSTVATFSRQLKVDATVVGGQVTVTGWREKTE